jgi:cell division protein FtsB
VTERLSERLTDEERLTVLQTLAGCQAISLLDAQAAELAALRLELAAARAETEALAAEVAALRAEVARLRAAIEQADAAAVDVIRTLVEEQK